MRLPHLLTIAVALCAVAGLGGCASSTDFPATEARAAPPGWSEVAESPLSARHDPLVAAVAGRFLVIGGSTGSACPPNASCIAADAPIAGDGAAYDPGTDRWTRIAAAPVPISSHRWAVIGSSLYLLTGFAGEATERFLVYDADRDRWATLPSPAHSPETLVAMGDRIIAIASDDADEAGDAVFDPEAATWTALPDDPLGPSTGRQGAVIGGRLLLTGAKRTTDSPPVQRLAVLDAAMRTWTRLPDSEIIGGDPTVVGGRVVFPMLGDADGGSVDGWGRSYDYGGVLDLGAGTWSRLPAAREIRATCESGWSPSTGVPSFVVGDQILIAGCRFDPVRGSLLPIPAPEFTTRFAEGSATDHLLVFVWGGATAGRNLSDGHLLRLPT